MGFWPFGGGKRQRASEPARHAREQSLQSNPPEKMPQPESAGPRTPVKNEQGTKPRRLSKNQTRSPEQIVGTQTAPVFIPAASMLSRGSQTWTEKQLYQQKAITSQSSLGPENFTVGQRPPTLHARRTENDPSLTHRKSSKRKAEDYAREREVRAMSSSPIPIPRRLNSFYDSGPLQRETKEIPSVLGRRLNRPASQVSLPLPEAFPDVDNIPYQNSFKIGIFAALSPRPTIKYDANPKFARGKQPQRQPPQTRPSIPEEDTDPEDKRIEELADDLDAGGLRELMERDKRRRERKKQTDHTKLQRKLQRRAERQREEEARIARTEEYVSATASRISATTPAVRGRSAVGDEGVASSSSKTRAQGNEDPFSDPKSETTSPVVIRNPFEDEKDMDVTHDPASDMETEPAVSARSPRRKIKMDKVKSEQKPSRGAFSPPTSPVPRAHDRQSTSQGSLLNRELTAEVLESASLTGGASDHSSQRLSSWTAFFSRGTRRKVSSSFQGRSTPSEFSNTSRESFTRKQPPPVITTRTFRRPDSATPQRTLSKFREDLPELPISPPDSRIQSPETTLPPATNTLGHLDTQTRQGDEVDEETEQSTFTPSSPIPAGDYRERNKQSIDLDAPTSGRPNMILSQSLASVDSEASWLSGKPLHRRSGASQKLQTSRSSLTQPPPGTIDGVVDAQYSPESPASPQRDGGTAAEVIPKGDETWHAGVGRQPTLIQHASRAKSKEGLVNEYATQSKKESNPGSEDDDPEAGHDEGEPEVTLMRAKSVDYKGHARHISAGSAKLLEIRRTSVASEDLLSQQSTTAPKQEQ